MTTAGHETESWIGRTVHGRGGVKLGRLTRVFPSDGGGPPTWGVVKSRRGGGRLVPLDGAAAHGERGVAVPVDRGAFRTAPVAPDGEPTAQVRSDLDRHYAERGALAAAHERQHERFGGLKAGASFFGWLVAVGLTVLLGAAVAGVAAAAGVSLDLASSPAQAAGPPPETVGLIGGALLLAVLALSYFGGGYVAGRLARFDGARNGFGVWALGLLVTAALTAVGAIAGARYNLLEQIQVPAMSIPTTALTIGGVVTLTAVTLASLAAAVLGGKAGERYHRKVERAATIVE
ncbi:hypothetical protein ACVGVM_20130 [Pseudonocardia bannensis]|uniref:Uncharacterized protein n=1 Tax=Pseudonocardia bannensis TaxID=630973 RepID=A0A848DF91_9PSEU|nr:hypothetical protein [Pseudonocardia bannensis]NMH91256.1 hypothetical protein [Pseudonocardia bannensis]